MIFVLKKEIYILKKRNELSKGEYIYTYGIKINEIHKFQS